MGHGLPPRGRAAILTTAVQREGDRSGGPVSGVPVTAIFHGKKGELYQRYHKGMEDQLGALGLVLNCVVLWNTFYIDAALDQLRTQGRIVLDEESPGCRPSCGTT